MSTATIADILDVHRFNKGLGMCACGAEMTHTGNRSAEHRAHLADMLAAALGVDA
jgi:hypothetical protein